MNILDAFLVLGLTAIGFTVLHILTTAWAAYPACPAPC